MEFRLSLFLLVLLVSQQAEAFDKNYGTEAEIPEPLLFDLVRRVNSDKNELEINTIVIQHQHNEFGRVYIAPEIEYAFADGMAIEFELPVEEGKIKSYKSALQVHVPTIIGEINGFQLIYEKANNSTVQKVTPLFLIGKHISGKWSTISMVGSQLVYGKKPAEEKNDLLELPILNVNIFYDYADMVDIGCEMNLRGVEAGHRELIMMPQMHSLIGEDFKTQFGFGTSYDGKEFSTLSAFRLIKEFNSM